MQATWHKCTCFKVQIYSRCRQTWLKVQVRSELIGQLQLLCLLWIYSLISNSCIQLTLWSQWWFVRFQSGQRLFVIWRLVLFDFSKAIKFYTYDVCFNSQRIDSWAGLALSKMSQLEQKLNSVSLLDTYTHTHTRAHTHTHTLLYGFLCSLVCIVSLLIYLFTSHI